MKYLNGKDAMKGDAVIVRTPDGTVIVGTVHQLVERTEHIRVSGYPLLVLAKDAALAEDALAALVSSLPKETPPA